MAGIPIVAVGPKLGNGPMFPDQSTYEVNELFGDMCSDDIESLKVKVEYFLSEPHHKTSTIQRELAIQLFGKEKIKQEWDAYFLR